MEYMLTERMNAPTGNAPQTILIPLNDKITVAAQRTDLSKTDDGYIWRGVIDGTGEPVTLLWWPSGRLAGTVMYKGHAYVIKNLEGNMHGMLEFTPDKMPPDHGAASKEMMTKMGMHSDPLVHDGDASMMLPATAQPPSMKLAPAEGASKDATITLIVAYTKKAASHYTDIVKDMIDVAIAQTNQSFRDSGAGNVHVKLVHAYETDYVENGSHFDHVYRFRNKGDGYMDEIHDLRAKYGADVAVLVVDDRNGVRALDRVAAEAPDAITAIHHECAATMYSLGHEIGHLIGARHDRNLDDSTQPFPYGHGFVHGKESAHDDELPGELRRLPAADLFEPGRKGRWRAGGRRRDQQRQGHPRERCPSLPSTPSWAKPRTARLTPASPGCAPSCVRPF